MNKLQLLAKHWKVSERYVYERAIDRGLISDNCSQIIDATEEDADRAARIIYKEGPPPED